MAGYTKVFGSITTSSIWGKPHEVLRVWIYMLVNCDTKGVVEGSVPGLAHACHLTTDQFQEVLEVLMAPDPDSRTPDHDGRRVAPVPGGWQVLNYPLYRSKGQGKEGSRAPYMRDYRQRKSEGPEPPEATPEAPVPSSGGAPGGAHVLPPNVTCDTDANADAGTAVPPTGEPAARRSSGRSDLGPLREEVLAHWRAVAVKAGLPDVLKVGDRLRKAMDARLRDSAWLPFFREAVAYAALSPDGAWMRGQGDRKWFVTLEWLLKPEKAEEIAAKARAIPRRSRGMAADTHTAAQLQQVPIRKLAPAGAP